MIVVKLWGGIGNQLFQFVFGQYLKYRFNQEVYFDNNEFGDIDKSRKSELEVLNHDIIFCNNYPFGKTKGLKRKALSMGFNLLPKHHFCTDSNIPLYFKEDHTYYMMGFWQDIKYYDWLVKNIKDFSLKSHSFPKELESIKNEVLLSKSSASIHIRRGDYFTPRFISVYGVCDKAYFEKAIDVLSKNKSPEKYYVFTDDINWVKENIDLPTNSMIVPNYNISQFAYIELMSMCEHHIISNSSFSWWGAVLNSSSNSLIIAPNKWTLNSSNTLALDSWMKIEL